MFIFIFIFRWVLMVLIKYALLYSMKKTAEFSKWWLFYYPILTLDWNFYEIFFMNIFWLIFLIELVWNFIILPIWCFSGFSYCNGINIKFICVGLFWSEMRCWSQSGVWTIVKFFFWIPSNQWDIEKLICRNLNYIDKIICICTQNID